jgi:muramidase (phage lysozyme)
MARVSADTRVAAFLDAIAESEGTAHIGDHGYNVLVGSTPHNVITFVSYADHPRRVMHIRQGLNSSAAGRYQIIAPTFDSMKKRAGVHDFTPESQDLLAIALLDTCGALRLLLGDNVPGAFAAAAPVWASLPNAGYGQHENKMTQCLTWYANALAQQVPA